MIKIKFQRLLLIYNNYCLSCMPASMFAALVPCVHWVVFFWLAEYIKPHCTSIYHWPEGVRKMILSNVDLKYFRPFGSDHFVIRWVRCQAGKGYNEQNSHLPSAILHLDWSSTPAKMTRNTDICLSNILSPGIECIFYSDTK